MERASSDVVQSLVRGFGVIRAFDADHSELTLSEVAVRTGLTRAAARRFLLTLESVGYVRSDRRKFSLSPKLLELGYAYLSSLGLSEVAQPHLERLVTSVQASSSVFVLDGSDAVCVARVAAKRIVSVNIGVGTRFPAASTSAGRVLLASLPDAELDQRLVAMKATVAHPTTDPAIVREAIAEVRSGDWSTVDQDPDPALRSIAVPIHDSSGTTIAAVGLSVLSSEYGMDGLRDHLLPPLREHATAIETDLRHRAPLTTT